MTTKKVTNAFWKYYLELARLPDREKFRKKVSDVGYSWDNFKYMTRKKPANKMPADLFDTLCEYTGLNRKALLNPKSPNSKKNEHNTQAV